jgi:uncharacterized membrane protein (DUF373 family)
MAYVRHQRVLRKVLEVAFVAVTRKMIAFELDERAFQKGAVLTMLLVALAASSHVLHRVWASERHTLRKTQGPAAP